MRKAKPASTAHHSAPEIESPAVAVIGGGYWGKNLVRNFLDCIISGAQPITNGHEGLRVLKVLNASQASLNDKGRKINMISGVDIDLDSGPNSIAAPVAAYPQRCNLQGVFVHPSTIVDENVSIGRGTKIWHFSHMLSNSTIGGNCNIGQNVVIGPDVDIGMGCKIQNNVSVYKGITLQDGVFCGPSTVFTNI
jgi:hypothetical protein